LKGKVEKKNHFNKRKKKKSQKNECQIKKKITYHKLGLNDEIEKKLKFYKMVKNKNLK
jgi:hypothetical protein